MMLPKEELISSHGKREDRRKTNKNSQRSKGINVKGNKSTVLPGRTLRPGGVRGSH